MLRKLSCEVCLPDIGQYYDDIVDIVERSYNLLKTDDGHRHKGSKQLLQQGRVVILNDGVCLR